MSIWDGLSGRILRWNRNRDAATKQVCQSLRTYIGELSGNSAEEDQPIVVRNMLYAYYLAAISMMGDSLGDMLKQYKKTILGLSPQGILDFVSPFHVGHIIHLGLDHRSLLTVLLCGICRMYNRPESYGQAWRGCLDYGREGLGMQVALRRYDELSTILGLPQHDRLIGSMFWSPLAAGISHMSSGLFEHSDWSRMVDGMIAQHVSA